MHHLADTLGSSLALPALSATGPKITGFTAPVSVCYRGLAVRQTAAIRQHANKQSWRRIEVDAVQARALESFAGADLAGIDETVFRREQHVISVTQYPDTKRLFLATERLNKQTMAQL